MKEILQLLAELKTVTDNSRPNIKYKQQSELINKLLILVNKIETEQDELGKKMAIEAEKYYEATKTVEPKKTTTKKTTTKKK